MTPQYAVRARLIAVALALSVSPMTASAQEPVRPNPPPVVSVHPWKLAYARRIAREGMEAGEERERALKQALREWKRKQHARDKVGGVHATIVAPELSGPHATEPAPLRRESSRVGTTTFTPPANTIVNDRTGDSPFSGQSETSVAAFGDIVVAAWNNSSLELGQAWGTSSDGGVTWVDRGAPPPAPGVSGFVWISDPLVTVNEKTGAFYFSALCVFTNGLGPREGVGIVKGRWNGSTIAWGSPAIVRDVAFDSSSNTAQDFCDKEWAVADSATGSVYVTHTFFPLAGGSRILFQRADSSAATWSTPLQLSLSTPEEDGFVQGSRPVVDGDGHVYVVYHLIGQSFADFYKIRRSDNFGASFAFPVVAESLYTNFNTGPPGFNRFTAVDFCGITVDRSHGPHRGRVYLSWAESINWLDEVFALGGLGNKSEVEPNNNAVASTPVALGQTLRGSLASFSDPDLYALPLLQGQHIVVSADSAQASPLNGFRLDLVADDGVTALTHTEFDSGVNPVGGQSDGFPVGWMFTAPTSGTYYVRVNSSGGTGQYRLRTGLVHRDNERGRDQRDVFVGHSDDGIVWSDPVLLNEDPPGFDAFIPEISAAPDGGVYCSWYDYRDSAPAKDGGEASVYLARSGDGGATWTTLGALTDSLSDWSAAASNIVPNQGDYMTLFTSSTYVWSVWSDARRGNPDVFAARTPLIPTGAQVAVANVHLDSQRVTIDWLATPADPLIMRLYRSTDNGPFTFLDVVQFDAAGALTYADTTVVGDHGYTYRLGMFTNGVELFYGQVSVFLPGGFALSMAPPRPNPISGNSFVAAFSLASDGPADLILFDVSGREVLRRTVSFNKGPHTLTLPVPSGLHQGLYVLTLRQGGHNASTRAYLVR